MPRADIHPEYDHEREHLERALEAIRAEIERVGSSSPNAAYINAKIALHDMAVRRYKVLNIALESPYVGRLDLRGNASRSKPSAPAREKFGLTENVALRDDIEVSDDVTAYYIGEVEFENKANGITVIGWETPLANLFYEAIEGDASFETDTRTYRVTTHLKRNITIKQRKLVNITDDFDSRPVKPKIVTAKRDQAILESLADRRAGYLDKITGTIDRDQNRLIRADRDQVLLIQGVAGSGKSIIAQYRLAYLYKTSRGQLRAEECLIFGPSRLFLDYASRVLPSLQVEDIRQTTFADWACEQIGLTKYRLEDAALTMALSSGKPDEKERYRRASQLKNSKRMGDLLKRYVEHRKKDIALPPKGLSFKSDQIGNITLSINGAEVKSAFETATREGHVEHRERFVEVLHRKLLEQVDGVVRKAADALRKEGNELLEKSRETQNVSLSLRIFADDARHQYDADLEEGHTADSIDAGARALAELAEYYKRRGDLKIIQASRLIEESQDDDKRRELSEDLLTKIEASVESFWTPLNIIEDYRALLANKTLLAELGKGIFGDYEINVLNAIPQPKAGVIDVGDIAAMHRLHILFYGFKPKYKHIIVDEAQDVSPLQFESMRGSSQNGSVTILGDLAQSIYEHRGTMNWDEVRVAFDGLKINYAEITQSYRNTHEIMSFANSILSSMSVANQLILAKPFDRHDEPPQTKLLNTAREMHGEIVTRLQQFLKDGHENIAVITKTPEQCRDLSGALRALDFTEFKTVVSGDFEYKGGVVIIPVHLAKGLEFEAVILANASADQFTDSDFDTRLLYVASTRALHELHVLGVGRWCGQVERAVS